MKNYISEDMQEISREALRKIPKSVSRSKIAKEANVQSGWIWSFQNGSSKNPSFIFMVRIYNFLIRKYPKLMTECAEQEHKKHHQLSLFV